MNSDDANVLALDPVLQYRLDRIMNCPLSRDGRSKSRKLEDAWPELAPLVEAGFPLKDIWNERNTWNLSYRQFARVIARLRGVSARRRKKATTPPAALDRLHVNATGNASTVDPFKNLAVHEAKPKRNEYPGTLAADKLI